MSKLWSHLAAGFAFLSLGIIIGAKWIGGVDYTIEVRKIKQKRTSGGSSVSVPIDVDTSDIEPKKRKRRRKNKK
jgi:hypothetical protein